jgi:hypothetical protein
MLAASTYADYHMLRIIGAVAFPRMLADFARCPVQNVEHHMPTMVAAGLSVGHEHDFSEYLHVFFGGLAFGPYNHLADEFFGFLTFQCGGGFYGLGHHISPNNLLLKHSRHSSDSSSSSNSLKQDLQIFFIYTFSHCGVLHFFGESLYPFLSLIRIFFQPWILRHIGRFCLISLAIDTTLDARRF